MSSLSTQERLRCIHDVASGDEMRLRRAAQSSSCPPELLRALSTSVHLHVRQAVAGNTSTPSDVLEAYLVQLIDYRSTGVTVWSIALANPSTPRDAVLRVLTYTLGQYALCTIMSRSDTTDEQLREWSAHEDSVVRLCAVETLRARVEDLRDAARIVAR